MIKLPCAAGLIQSFSLMRTLRLIILTPVVVAFLAAAAVATDGLIDRAAQADAIVVPGNAVTLAGKPSARLAARLDAATRAYRAHLAPLVIVSGGVGREGFDEAKVMAAYLKAGGIPSSAILIDSQGIDTAATAANTTRILQARRLNSVLIATQFFHVTRTRVALQRAGAQVVGFLHAEYFELRDVYSLARELVGLVVYIAGFK